jgi:hypothetical protein
VVRNAAPAPDGYEPDDDMAGAKNYAGLQHHTFHSADDVDWVRLIVPSGAPLGYHVATHGAFIWQHVEALMPDGVTMLASWYSQDGRGVNSSLDLPGPGTYYLRIVPDGVNCYAQYDLLALPARLYLPVLLKNGGS